jgi:hypothetical protein
LTPERGFSFVQLYASRADVQVMPDG